MRIVDGWSWIIVSLEFGTCFWYWGEDGLFVAYVAAWICQAITLWFNVVNHPPDQAATFEMKTLKNTAGMATSSFNRINGDKKFIETHNIKKCIATNGIQRHHDHSDDTNNFYLPFLFLDALVPLFGFFVKELEHDHHHKFARLAKRSDFDVAYWGFIWPLEQLGLVWNVIVLA